MAPRKLLHVKFTTAKGKRYAYFRSGQKGANGKEILLPMPSPDHTGFFDSYYSFMGARAKREKAGTQLTVSDLCDLYEKGDTFRKLAAGSKRLYRFGIDYFKSQLPTAPAGLLERSDIVLLIDKRADTPGAANSLLRTINAVYKWARERGHVANDPGKDIRPLDIGEHDPWPDHALEAALKADDDAVRLVVHILYYTALRIDDALSLRWSDIRGGVIYVTPQKTQKTRGEMQIPIHRDLAAELERTKRTGLTIVASDAGKRLHQHTVRNWLKVFAAKHGAKVVPHGLRKNAVNALLECGCSVAETSAISGQTMATVEHYAKKRKQGSLASAAILRWEGNKR